jgi:TetR/AcrR family tetracycline transcriptional repressor
VVSEHLTREAVAEQAITLADTEGIAAVTIRRLAQLLGVTPMALYWHFKNKEELLAAVADHVLGRVKATRRPEDPWDRQLRAMVEALVDAMRRHPSLPALLQLIEKQETSSFIRALNDALELLTTAGFDLARAYWVASYLLQGSIGLVATAPHCPTSMSGPDAAEWRRQKRLAIEKLSPSKYPMMAAYARTFEQEIDVEAYYAFGIDLLMAGVTAMAAGRPSPPDRLTTR